MRYDYEMNDIELEGLIVTPGEILERMNEMKRVVSSLDFDIASNAECKDAAFLRDWSIFKVAFAAYLTEYEGWTDRAWGSAMDVADKWAEQIANWQKRYAQVCKKAASGIRLSDNTAGNPKLPDMELSTKLIIGGVVVVIAAGAAYYFLKVKK
jgi:hypothetical protein